MSGLRAHIRGNVIGYVALFAFATSGTAAALDGSNTVFSDDIVNGQVKTADVGTGQVRAVDVADDTTAYALTGTEIAADTLTGADVDEPSLDSTVLQRRLQSGCAVGEAVAAIDAAGNPSCVTTGGPPSGPAGGSLAGTYPDPAIAADAIGSATVADGALTGADIADTSTISGPEVNEAGLFNDNSIAATDLAADSVGTSEVDGSLIGANIVDGSLGSGEITDNSLTGTDVSESSLAKVPDADELDGDDSADYRTPGAFGSGGTCDPNTTALIECTAAGLTLDSTSSVLVVASGTWTGEATGDDTGQCKLRRDNLTSSSGAQQTITLGQNGNEHVFQPSGFARTALFTGVPAGVHNWALTCLEASGDFIVHNSQIAVVRLSG